MSLHLVLGGARSGKSSFAESAVHGMELSAERNVKRHYIATAIAFDDEMKQRIHHHKVSRGDGWQEHECPYELPRLMNQFNSQDVVLIDCLTLWLNNVIYNHGQPITELEIKQKVQRLVEALEVSDAEIVLVSNEVGLGVVPMGEVSRLFVDHAGWMNQAIAKIASKVTFVAAGLPLVLKTAIDQQDRP